MTYQHRVRTDQFVATRIQKSHDRQHQFLLGTDSGRQGNSDMRARVRARFDDSRADRALYTAYYTRD